MAEHQDNIDTLSGLHTEHPSVTTLRNTLQKAFDDGPEGSLLWKVASHRVKSVKLDNHRYDMSHNGEDLTDIDRQIAQHNAEVSKERSENPKYTLTLKQLNTQVDAVRTVIQRDLDLHPATKDNRKFNEGQAISEAGLRLVQIYSEIAPDNA